MKSTGKYWIPVYDILEQNEMKPILTHPKYVKQAKDKKTDFRDAIHIAKPLPHGSGHRFLYPTRNAAFREKQDSKQDKILLVPAD